MSFLRWLQCYSGWSARRVTFIALAWIADGAALGGSGSNGFLNKLVRPTAANFSRRNFFLHVNEMVLKFAITLLLLAIFK